MPVGWSCPKCGGAHAPWVASCPVIVTPVPYVVPSTQPPGWWQNPVTCKPSPNQCSSTADRTGPINFS
jgi:hypothetical protein